MNRLANVGLALLALLAVVMIAVALRASSADPAKKPDVYAVDVTPTPSASRADDPDTTASAEPSDDAPLPDAWFAALRHGTLVRAPADDCTPGAPALTIGTSADGGRSFTEAVVEDLGSVTGISIMGQDRATILGADLECELATFETVDQGASWTQRSTLPKFWSLLYGIDDQIQSPAGRVDVPCVPKGVSGIDGNVARLWCEDGRLMGTASAGDSWVVLGRVPAGSAMVFPTLASGYVLGEADDCAGRTVMTTENAGATWEQVHCSTIDGPWGLAADGRTVVVAGGDAADASPDGGRTWASR